MLPRRCGTPSSRNFASDWRLTLGRRARPAFLPPRPPSDAGLWRGQARMARLAVLIGTLVLALGLAAVARAEGARRVALVIANAHYSGANVLKNPISDASLVEGALKRAGFATIDSEADLTNGALRDALRRFSAAAAGADVAVIYYAGHGIEARGTNWLLPVDATLQTDSDLDYEAVN